MTSSSGNGGSRSARWACQSARSSTGSGSVRSISASPAACSSRSLPMARGSWWMNPRRISAPGWCCRRGWNLTGRRSRAVCRGSSFQSLPAGGRVSVPPRKEATQLADTDAPIFAHRYQPGAGGSHVTLLLLHGTGGDESDLLPLGSAVAPQAALLSPRGKVLERGLPRFFRRLAEGVFDIEDLTRRTHELADFVEAAAGTYGFDAAQVVALGYSNGANIAASLLLLRPQVLAGAALLRPMLPLVPATPPDLRGKHVLIAAGQHDSLVPASSTRQLADLLQQSGADVTMQWLSAGHGLTSADVATVIRWLADRFRIPTAAAP